MGRPLFTTVEPAAFAAASISDELVRRASARIAAGTSCVIPLRTVPPLSTSEKLLFNGCQDALHTDSPPFLGLTAARQTRCQELLFADASGRRVDACLSGGVAASGSGRLCKVQGYDHALIFQRETSVETRVIDSGNLCTGAACTAFKQVKCFHEKRSGLSGLAFRTCPQR